MTSAPGGRVEAGEHLPQRRSLRDVAGEQLGAAHEAAAVEHQAEGDQLAVRALFLGAAARGLGVVAGIALEISIGEIIQRDADRQAEQVLDAAEQRRLDRLAVAHQQVGGAVKADQRHGFEVGADQFAERAALAQPAPGGQFAAGRGHAADQQAGGGVALDAVEAEIGEDAVDTEPADGGETGGLDSGRARAGELQRGDVDLGVERIGRGGLSGWRLSGWRRVVAGPVRERRRARHPSAP